MIWKVQSFADMRFDLTDTKVSYPKKFRFWPVKDTIQSLLGNFIINFDQILEDFRSIIDKA